MSTIEVEFPREENAGKIIKWRVSKGTIISAGRVLLSYQDVNSSNNSDCNVIEKKLRATEFGRVTELLVRQGDIVQPGKLILSMTGCTHPTVMKDLCAECGVDLRQESQNDDEKNKKTTQASVPMLHSIPELKVCPELAEKIGKADEERLLNDKKLALLVDLDQTIVHTTHEDVPVNMKDVKHFQLHGGYSQWYHTKLRPGTEHFLTEMSKLYELHICTFGSRSYAHKVTELLDKKGELFSHRILSRDECFNPVLKAANLHALFPCGDDLVCIIDDREDVWQGCGNLVQVKPYNFFRHTGDIHAPPGLDKKEPVVELAEVKNSELKKEKLVEEPEGDKNEIKNDEKKSIEKEEEKIEIKENTDDVKINEEPAIEKIKLDVDTDKKSVEENKLPNEDNNSNKNTKPIVDVKKNNNVEKKVELPDDDHDDYLLYLEDILKRIHSEFYDHIEKSERKALKEIIPSVRARVLKGLHLTFSGLVPTHQKLYQSRAYKVARAFGAEVSEDLNENTTHLVAIQPGTAKVHAAKKNSKIKIVNSDWLWSCAERWELVDERLYPLTLKARGSRIPPPHCSSPGRVEEEIKNDTFASSINPLMSFSKEEIDDMGNEVEEDMSESEMDNTNINSRDLSIKRELNDSDSSDECEGAPVKRVKTIEKKNSQNDSDEEDDDDKNEIYGDLNNGDDDDDDNKKDDDDDDNEGEDDEDPVTIFRRGGGLPDYLDLGDNSQDSVDLDNDDYVEEDDDGEWNEMGAALERGFLSD